MNSKVANVSKLTPDQLNFAGDVEHTPVIVRRLPVRQADLLRYVRMAGVIYTREAGRFYADPGGALRRLERAGLVRRRTGRGRWEATS